MINIETFPLITPEICKENPNYLFIFGENEYQFGSKITGGGQAIIRPEANSYGIITKKSAVESYTDEDFIRYKSLIDNQILQIKAILVDSLYNPSFPLFQTIVFPTNGIGTGRAMMMQNCPRLFLYLSTKLLDEFTFNNLFELKSNYF